VNIIIKLFSTPKGKYAYDRETNSILSLNDDEFSALQRIQDGNATTDDLKVLETFQRKGFCKESSLRQILHPHEKFLEFHLDSKMEKITLQVTQNCNLRCAYCAYSGMYHQRSHTDKVMSYETMKKSADFLMHHATNSRKVDIGFYGGEPLLEFERIKSLVDYIKQTYPYKDISYTITTNGTLFTEEVINFLSDSGFNVNVSIDGPKEIHDKNRVFINGSGSFDSIMSSLRDIKRRNPEFFKKISFSTVIAPGSDFKCVDDFYSANEVIEDNFLFTTTVNEFGNIEEIQYDEKYFISYNIQRTKMLLYLLGMVEKDQVSKLVLREIAEINRFYKNLGTTNGLRYDAHPGGPCIPGAKRTMVDAEGYLYPCERVSESSNEMRIGHIDSGFDLNKAKQILNIGQLTQGECMACWNFVHCSLCAAAADDGRKLSGKSRLNYCEGAMNTTLTILKTICLLKENSFNFEEARYGK